MKLETGFAILCMAISTCAGATTLKTTYEPPVLGTITPVGCFDSKPGDATPVKAMTFLTAGVCTDACLKKDKPVALLSGNQCLCSDFYPVSKTQVADDDCNYPCPGYAMQACGNLDGDVSVYNTGLLVNVQEDGGSQNDGEKEDNVPWQAVYAIASGAWRTGESAASNIVNNLCEYFDCGEKRGRSMEEV
ncbi:WSC domain-containing protein [Sarocladium implicatum]|nr:WSC domain-containing protein [Sarocladium implicatum]